LALKTCSLVWFRVVLGSGCLVLRGRRAGGRVWSW